MNCEGYELLALISTSGFHKSVFIGRELNTGQLVALKTYKTTVSLDLLERDVLIPEALFTGPEAKFLSVPKYLGYRDGLHWIREPLWYCDLHKHCISNGAIRNLSTIIDITHSLFGGLRYIHSCGARHTDIKLENIGANFFSEVSKFILGDFGCLSFEVAAVPKDEKFWGSLKARPPELLMENPALSQLSDVWSAAASIFACTLGRYPIVGLDYKREKRTSIVAHFRRNYRELFESLQSSLSIDWPPCLTDVLGPCLSDDPSKRLTAGQVVEKIETMRAELNSLQEVYGPEVESIWEYASVGSIEERGFGLQPLRALIPPRFY